MANTTPAWRKGDPATLIGIWSDGTAWYRHVEVVSCGLKRMTLKDAGNGELLGHNYEPVCVEHITEINRSELHHSRSHAFRRLADAQAYTVAVCYAAMHEAKEKESAAQRLASLRWRHGMGNQGAGKTSSTGKLVF